MKLFGARARKFDPETSHEAAESVSDVTVTQERILNLLRLCGEMTDAQICEEYEYLARTNNWRKQTDQSIRSRRSELVRKKQVAFAESYGTSPTGRRARVWKAL